MACDPIRAEGLQNIDLGLARGCGAAIGQVDDLALLGAVYRRMRLFDKALQPFRQPMIAACLPALPVHSLLHHDPVALIGYDEAVQVQVEPILHRGTIDLGDQPAGSGQSGAVKADPLANCDQLLRGLPGVLAAASANVDPQLVRERGQAALQRADHARRNARRMPIHAHHGTERLEPEGMGEAPQQLVAAIMMDDGLADQRAQIGHPISKPLRDAAAVQRKVGRSGFIGHQSNCPGGGPRPPRTKLEVHILFAPNMAQEACHVERPPRHIRVRPPSRWGRFQARTVRSTVAVRSRRSSSYATD